MSALSILLTLTPTCHFLFNTLSTLLSGTKVSLSTSRAKFPLRPSIALSLNSSAKRIGSPSQITETRNYQLEHVYAHITLSEHKDKILKVNMKVWGVKSLLSALMMLGAGTRAWEFAIYPDTGCETTANAHYTGSGNQGCTSNPTNHRCFELSNMGDCWIALYSTEQNCQNGVDEDQYNSVNENDPISPDYTWDWYEIWGC